VGYNLNKEHNDPMSIDMHALAALGAASRLQELAAEADAILNTFPDLRETPRRVRVRIAETSDEKPAKTPKPAKAVAAASNGNGHTAPVKSKRSMMWTAERRAAQSKRMSIAMRKMWREKMKRNAADAAAAAQRQLATTQRMRRTPR
jgi:hypothetical protein